MDEDRAVGGPYLRVCFDTFDTCWKILHDAGDRDDNVFSHVVDLVSAIRVRYDRLAAIGGDNRDGLTIVFIQGDGEGETVSSSTVWSPACLLSVAPSTEGRVTV